MQVDTIWRNARLATMAENRHGLGIVEDGTIAARDGRIVYCGGEVDCPALQAREVIDCEGRWITPGLIDCHTHLVFGGDRVDEFRMKLAGARYADLAEVGGIRTTMSATRCATPEQLVADALIRLDALIAEGVTTVEAKSGYGLDEETELRQLAVARSLSRHRRINVSPTYLGLHAVPPEFQGDANAYVDLVASIVIPRIAAEDLAESVDAFCEGIAFTPAQVDRVFAVARRHGLPVRLHADQLSDTGGAALAARHAALSADHLEHASEMGIAAMATSDSVAVLLPGAFLRLRETQRPPVDAMRRHGVRIAVATDLNPGSSPLASPLLAMALAASLFGLTVEECLLGMTRQAAHALGRGERTGTLEEDKDCDLAIWSIEQPTELVYWMGLNRLHQRVCGGQ